MFLIHISHLEWKKSFWCKANKIWYLLEISAATSIKVPPDICAQWMFGSESSQGAFLDSQCCKVDADNENSDQTARISRLIWVFVGLRCQKVSVGTLRRIPSQITPNRFWLINCSTTYWRLHKKFQLTSARNTSKRVFFFRRGFSNGYPKALDSWCKN